jgi:hypothetical protein
LILKFPRRLNSIEKCINGATNKIIHTSSAL